MGESRARAIGIRLGVMRPNVGTERAIAILAAAAAWSRVHGHAPAREDLFRALAELEGVPMLAWYGSQRVAWERGWLVVGTCEVTAEGWRLVRGEERAA